MKIRFQGDANFNSKIISGLLRAEPEIDFRTADDANLRGVPDHLVLLVAKQEDRILLTHDRRTMPHHFANLIQKEDCPGVFLVSRNVPIRIVIENLILIWHGSDSEEWTNLFTELPL